MKLTKSILLLMLLGLLVGSTGCIFSPEDNKDPGTGGTETYPPATTPEQLLINFGDIYEDMDAQAFASILHDDYKTILLPSTMEEWQAAGNPLAEDIFYRDTEIRIHENMFSGNTGVRPNNENVPPIDSIEVNYLTKEGTWNTIPETHEHFAGHGGYWAQYNVLIYFNTPDQFSFKVQQKVDFYVVPVTEGGQEIWKLLGQIGHEPSNSGD